MPILKTDHLAMSNDESNIPVSRPLSEMGKRLDKKNTLTMNPIPQRPIAILADVRPSIPRYRKGAYIHIIRGERLDVTDLQKCPSARYPASLSSAIPSGLIAYLYATPKIEARIRYTSRDTIRWVLFNL